MSKDISKILQKGNLTPKERVLLLVQSTINKERTGKEILSPADEHALVTSWTPKNNQEVREYNRYNQGWRAVGFAELDAQTTFLNTEISYYRTIHLSLNFAFYPAYKSIKENIQRIEQVKRVDMQEAIEIANRQREVKLEGGEGYERAIYALAFESLSDKDQKELDELYGEVEHDTEYLDQQEVLARLFDDKGELTTENKEQLAGLVAARAYNSYSKQYQLYHYYACFPLAEVARYFLASKGIEVKGKKLNESQESGDEDDVTHQTIKDAAEVYAKSNNTTIEALLKEGFLRWLDDGLLEDYRPLILSNRKALLTRWLSAKGKTRTILDGFVSSGKLKIETVSSQPKTKYNNSTVREMVKMGTELKGETRDLIDDLGDTYPPQANDYKNITGESLYNFNGDYKFVREFKKYVDQYTPNLGIVYEDNDPEHLSHVDRELLICTKTSGGKVSHFSFSNLALESLKRAFEETQIIKETEEGGVVTLALGDGLAAAYRESRADLIKGYGTLLAFKELFSRLSKAYETDLTYKINKWIETLGSLIDNHNEALKNATGENNKPLNNLQEQVEVKLKDDLFIEKGKIEPNKVGVEAYFAEFEKVMGEDF